MKSRVASRPAPTDMFDRLWCFHDPVPRTGPLNMALDEQMLEFTAAECAPVLRTYRWSEPFVSIGYFDRIDSIEGRFPGRLIVRRWTGGGAVDHRADFTFSLAVPAEHALARRPGEQRYREIHRAIASALERCGVATRSAGREPTVARGAAQAPCFEATVCGDLLLGQQKIVGGAQRRTRLGVLHQGSIQTPVLKADWSAIGGALASAFSVEQLPLRPAAELMARASALAASKYAAPAWHRAR